MIKSNEINNSNNKEDITMAVTEEAKEHDQEILENIPTIPEIINARTEPKICKDTDKIYKIFPWARDIGEFVDPRTICRKPAPTIDLTKLERKPNEIVRFFWIMGATFFDRHPLDLLREELIDIYQGGRVIVANEASFYKYETLIRIAHGMIP